MPAPSAFRWPEAREAGPHARIRHALKRITRFDLFPGDEIVDGYARLLTTGDPVAERFVDETFLGSHSQVRARLTGGETVEFLEFSHRASRWSRGEPVALKLDTAMLTFFDAATGLSVMAGGPA